MKKSARVTVKNIATIIALNAEQWPKEVKPNPDLYVSPNIYKLGLQAIKNNEPGFYKVGKTPFFRGFRIVKFK